MNNIATQIEILYEKAKAYTETSIELTTLNAIDKTADLVSLLVTRSIVIIMIGMFVFFMSIALSLYLGDHFGKNYLGFLAVSGLYLTAYFVITKWSHRIIKIPVANLVIETMLKTKSSDNN